MFPIVLFTFFAIPLADAALRFGPPELFAVYLLAFATLTGLESGNPLKSLAMIGFGLLLAAVGLDALTGTPRLTFGQGELRSGIGFVPVSNSPRSWSRLFSVTRQKKSYGRV